MRTTHEASATRHRRQLTLPQLGRRGGGWVAAQVVMLAAILLSALVGVGWPAPLAPIAYVAGALLLTLGAALLVVGGIGLGSALTPFPAPRVGSRLRTTGVYSLVRHPMYGGGILIGAGWSIVFATVLGVVLTVALAVFAHLKSRREELWLEQSHSDYADYRSRTRHRFIPYVW